MGLIQEHDMSKVKLCWTEDMKVILIIAMLKELNSSVYDIRLHGTRF